jgi:Ni,Fe-hydrogenase III large subunit
MTGALDMLDREGPVASVRVDTGRLGPISRELAARGARLADLFGERGDDGTIVLRVVYALDPEGRYLILESALEPGHAPMLAELDPGAFVEQCELCERFGVRPDRRTRMNRVLTAPRRAHGAMDGGAPHAVAHDYEPHVVTGEAFEFPFGPVRAAGWESLYMGLVTTGEEVLDLYLMQWHKHRGVERRLRGLDPERAAFLVERTDGLSAVGDTVAFCRAVEVAAGICVSPAAEHARVVAVELERLYNHTAAIAATCQTTGLAVGQARVEIALERLLRLNAAAFGHRYLFGVIRPGGVTRAPRRGPIRDQLGAIARELAEVNAALLATNSYVDRLEATGTVTPEQARRLSLVGPIARASGQGIDTRIDHPVGAAEEAATPELCVRHGGDVLARLEVMLGELEQSRLLIERSLDSAGADCAQAAGGPGEALGWAESPRGEALAWVALDAAGRLEGVRLRPASVRNWRAFDDAARSQNVFTDIPIIEASFWLTVAGFAR